jgi:MoaA/NifB/PqqE/SkfB family radical SAM enzyme
MVQLINGWQYSCQAARKGLHLLLNNRNLFREKLSQHSFPLKLAFMHLLRKNTAIGPESVQIGISNRCNYRCIFCLDHPSFVSKDQPYPDAFAEKFYKGHPEVDFGRENMDLELFKRLVDDLHDLGTRRVSFTGKGEPFMNPHVLEMAEYVKRKKLYCLICTNGSLLKEKTIEELIRIGVDRINVSFNAGSPETYARIHSTEKPEKFEQLISRLKGVSDLKKKHGKNCPEISLSFALCKYTYREIREMVNIGISTGADSLSFVKINIYEDSKFLDLTEEENKELMHHLGESDELAGKHNIATNIQMLLNADETFAGGTSWNFYKKVPCYVGLTFSLILADGTVNPCCDGLRFMGNIKEKSFKEIWLSDEYKTFRKESLEMPVTGKMAGDCRCHQCDWVRNNLYFHNFLLFLLFPGLRERMIKAHWTIPGD